MSAHRAFDLANMASSTQSGGPARARALVPRSLRSLHDTVIERASRSAEALLLIGSTARDFRTRISDLDYHLVGGPIATDDLSAQLDVHVVSPFALGERVVEGDDFMHWSLRFGCVIFDNGIVGRNRRMIQSRGLWPDPTRKEQQARKSLKIACAMVASGDRDAALEQVRTALTLTARWQLLVDGCFPLSRAELPAQLEETGRSELAAGLAATIYCAPPLTQLDDYLQIGSGLLDRVCTGSGSRTDIA